MHIIPVIDIRNGIVVRAVAGNRGEYRRLESCLTPSAEPAAVLQALESRFRCGVCYVADLDAIERAKVNRCTLAEMQQTGVRLLVDAGVKTPEDARQLLDLGVSRVVVASESLANIRDVETFRRSSGADNLVFSVDLKYGELLTADDKWNRQPPIDLINTVADFGVHEFIILDLAAVGTGTGTPTLSLCKEIKRRRPELSVISGGGVNSPACIETARQANLDGLLISSALHDGRISEL